ncbi:MAG TPA: o-succinylbenzoate synthase [Bacteroidota bacterium]|nr:o-succinylbenzoate synthase [Bacteroidota bacterium]
MNVDQITLTHVRVPFNRPLRNSNGEVTEKEAIIVQVASGGIVGTGEASPMTGSFYSDDTPSSVWKFLAERLVPAAISSRAGSVKEINRVIGRAGGSPCARAGIETAFWDLEARSEGKPLCAHLGGSRVPIASGLSVGIEKDIPRLLDTIAGYIADGYRRVKIAVRPGWDVGPLGEIRQRFGDIPLMVDASGSYAHGDIPHIRSFDAFDLAMIEQPLPADDLNGHARLQALIHTPVCLDESVGDLPTLRRAVRGKCCRIVNIAIQRVGGLSAARDMHDFCSAAGIPVWAGTMPELGIGGAHTLHLATLPGFAYPTDVVSSSRWFESDIVAPPIEVKSGVVTLPAGAGTGFELSGEAIARYRIAQRVFKP